MRVESETYEVPTFKVNNAKPLIYFSYGSLGVADVDLIKRIIGVLADAPYRVLVNVGDYIEQYGTPPDNVQIASWYRQTAVLPHVDVFIQHGGNNSFNESLYFGIPPIVMPSSGMATTMPSASTTPTTASECTATTGPTRSC